MEITYNEVEKARRKWKESRKLAWHDRFNLWLDYLSMRSRYHDQYREERGYLFIRRDTKKV